MVQSRWTKDIIMLKSCSKCGRLHEFGYTCRAGNKIDYGKYNYKEASLRNTYSWHTKAEYIKAESNYLCSVCLAKGIYNYNNLEVHHIHKLKDREDLLLDNYNLICLCRECHALADAGMIDKEYLLDLARKREDTT